jgi:hypothetical protein
LLAGVVRGDGWNGIAYSYNHDGMKRKEGRTVEWNEKRNWNWNEKKNRGME